MVPGQAFQCSSLPASGHDDLQSPVEGTPPCRTSSVLDDAIAEEIEEQPVVLGSVLPSSAFGTKGHKSGRVAPHEELQDEVAPWTALRVPEVRSPSQCSNQTAPSSCQEFRQCLTCDHHHSRLPKELVVVAPQHGALQWCRNEGSWQPCYVQSRTFVVDVASKDDCHLPCLGPPVGLCHPADRTLSLPSQTALSPIERLHVVHQQGPHTRTGEVESATEDQSQRWEAGDTHHAEVPNLIARAEKSKLIFKASMIGLPMSMGVSPGIR